MPEKRKARRMDLECKLLLKRVDTLDKQTSKEVSVKITDVSKDGIGFECSEELRVGSVYQHSSSSSWCPARSSGSW